MLGIIVLCTCALLAAVLITLLGIWYTLAATKDKIELCRVTLAQTMYNINTHAMTLQKLIKSSIKE